MLPYVKLQLVYAALALVATAFLWWASRGVEDSLRSRVLRIGAILLGLAAATAGAWVLVTGILGLPYASGFSAVALTFYAGALWLPLFALASLAGRNGRPRDALGVLVLSLVSLLIGLDATLVEPNRLQVREEHVVVPQWPVGAPPVRIVHLSDLQTVGACERERVALERVRELDPDLVVLTGDYIAGPFFDTGPAAAAARAFLAGLSARHGVIAVAGHSEVEEHRAELFRGLDLVYSKNAEHRIDLGDGRTLDVIGLHPWEPDLSALERPKEPGEVRLVLSHVPDVSRRLDGLGVDLHLAGHTHGGQIVIPGFGPPLTLSSLPRDHARGLFRFGDHWLNVCAGLGMEGNHAPRIRFFCPPEICLIVLEGPRASSAAE